MICWKKCSDFSKYFSKLHKALLCWDSTSVASFQICLWNFVLVMWGIFRLGKILSLKVIISNKHNSGLLVDRIEWNDTSTGTMQILSVCVWSFLSYLFLCWFPCNLLCCPTARIWFLFFMSCRVEQVSSLFLALIQLISCNFFSRVPVFYGFCSSQFSICN